MIDRYAPAPAVGRVAWCRRCEVVSRTSAALNAVRQGGDGQAWEVWLCPACRAGWYGIEVAELRLCAEHLADARGLALLGRAVDRYSLPGELCPACEFIGWWCEQHLIRLWRKGIAA